MAQGLQGLWVSLAYTRAFGTLGLQFKSGQTHHLGDFVAMLIYVQHKSSPWQIDGM